VALFLGLRALKQAQGELLMATEEKIAIVDAYPNGLANKDLSKVSFAEDVTFEGPVVGKLAGRQTIVTFMTSILPFIKAIHIKQHLIEGDYVATLFDMETVSGTDRVFDCLHVAGGELKSVKSFYYPHSPVEVRPHVA
jgi:SnoaL-like domain